MTDNNRLLELFTQPIEYEEGPVRDRKRDIPCLLKEKPWEKAEFIRDCISLANSARLFGRNAYFLYGIDDDGEIYGVAKSIESYHLPDRPDHTEWEEFKKYAGQTFEQYITPGLANFDVQHGKIDGKEVAYLIIGPQNLGTHFSVKRLFFYKSKDGKDEKLEAGKCWIRFGEHKGELDAQAITDGDALYSYAATDCPYLLPVDVMRYCTNLLDYGPIKKAMGIQGYQDIRTSDGQKLENTASTFLSDKSKRLLVISGPAGCGKSSFIFRYCDRLAEDSKFAVEQAYQREEYLMPETRVPIYFSLRGCEFLHPLDLVTALVHCAANTFCLFGESSSRSPSNAKRIFEFPGLQWIICLDGFDEMWIEGSRDKFMNALRNLITSYPHIKVIVTTRTDCGDIEYLQGYKQSIARLDVSDVRNYFSSLLATRQPMIDSQGNQIDTLTVLTQLLPVKQDFWRLISLPVILGYTSSGLIDDFQKYFREIIPHIRSPKNAFRLRRPSFDNWERPIGYRNRLRKRKIVKLSLRYQIINMGPLLNMVYQSLWQREMDRRPEYPNYSDTWYQDTGKLAIAIKNRLFRDATAKEQIAGEAIPWLLGLGILERQQEDKLLHFIANLTQVYFGAHFLSSLLKAKEYAEVCQSLDHVSEEFKEKVVSMLLELDTTVHPLKFLEYILQDYCSTINEFRIQL